MANASVVSASEGLADVVTKRYTEQVTSEMNALDSAYKKIEKTEREKSPIQWSEYATGHWQKQCDINDKIAAATSLSKSIKAIGITHSAITQDANNLTGNEVCIAVRTFVDDVSPVLKEVQEAFNGN